MDLNVLSTQNWSRAFNIWIEDVQVVCHPVVTAPFVIRNSLLRQFRSLSRVTAVVVTLLFALHCTRPQTAPAPAPTETIVADEATDKPEPRIFSETGKASWYGGDDGFAGRPTANGEIFDPAELTCAHRTLPFGTRVEVHNLDSGQRCIVRVNDRGPFIRGRILDVSEKAAHALGMMGAGTARVRIRTVDAKGRPAPLDPSAGQKDPFTIQVAALGDPANIARLSSELKPLFGPVTLQDAQAKGGYAVKRVRVGTYTTLEEAQKAAEEIAKLFKDRGIDPFITREH